MDQQRCLGPFFGLIRNYCFTLHLVHISICKLSSMLSIVVAFENTAANIGIKFSKPQQAQEELILSTKTL